MQSVTATDCGVGFRVWWHSSIVPSTAGERHPEKDDDGINSNNNNNNDDDDNEEEEEEEEEEQCREVSGAEAGASRAGNRRLPVRDVFA